MILDSSLGFLVEKTKARPLVFVILTAFPDEVVKASELSTPTLIPTPPYTLKLAVVASQDMTSFQGIVFLAIPYLTLIFSEFTFMLSFMKLIIMRAKTPIKMSSAGVGAGFHHGGNTEKD
jgi:hypothetical protein